MSTDPTFYVLDKPVGAEGISQGDLHKILWNLKEAIIALGEKIDEDVGMIGIDFAENVTTPLEEALDILTEPVSGDTKT